SCPETGESRGKHRGTLPGPHPRHPLSLANAGQFAPAPAPPGKRDTTPAAVPPPAHRPPGPGATTARGLNQWFHSCPPMLFPKKGAPFLNRNEAGQSRAEKMKKGPSSG